MEQVSRTIQCIKQGILKIPESAKQQLFEFPGKTAESQGGKFLAFRYFRTMRRKVKKFAKTKKRGKREKMKRYEMNKLHKRHSQIMS